MYVKMPVYSEFRKPKPVFKLKEPTNPKIENRLLAELEFDDVFPISNLPEGTTHIWLYKEYNNYSKETTQCIECYSILEVNNENYTEEMENYTYELNKFNLELESWEKEKLEYEENQKIRAEKQEHAEYLRLRKKYEK